MAAAKPQTPRDQLMTQLRPKLPSKWRLIKYEKNLDVPDRITVMVRQRKVDRLPQAPQGFYTTDSVLELLVPETDPELAEDALDVALFELVGILDSINMTLWQPPAEKVLDKDTGRLAYDVTIRFTTQKDAS